MFRGICIALCLAQATGSNKNLRTQMLSVDVPANSSESINLLIGKDIAEARGMAAFKLGTMAASCGCQFDGNCGCEGSLAFMNCIANACQSKLCDCQGGFQFLYACHNMSAVCPTVGLTCSTSHATCAIEQETTSNTTVVTKVVKEEKKDAK